MADLDCQQVPVCENVDAEIFSQIVERSKPTILKNCNFGDCVTKWTLEYLTEKLGDREIVIHKSSQERLDFLSKNFQYETCNFKTFSERLSQQQSDGESIYLRSTHNDSKAKRPASIDEDFPAISTDLRPPSFIPFGKTDPLYHSSVLRLASANLQIWTHFDIYDNVLCQVVGMKRVLLFPPEDSKYLHIDGDKSKINAFDSNCTDSFPSLRNASPWLCYLSPGDCLFIPKFWWHNIRSLNSKRSDQDFESQFVIEDSSSLSSYSIGFNIFWRDPQLVNQSLYAEGDIYGNRHLKPYDAALANVERALKHLEKLPPSSIEVYKLMLWKHIKKKMDMEK